MARARARGIFGVTTKDPVTGVPTKAQPRKATVAKGSVAKGIVKGPATKARQGGAKFGYGVGGQVKFTGPASSMVPTSGSRGGRKAGNRTGAGKGIVPVGSRVPVDGTPNKAGKSNGIG